MSLILNIFLIKSSWSKILVSSYCLKEFTSRATAGVHEEKGKDLFTLDDIGFLEKTIIHYGELQRRFPNRICMLEVAKKSRERVLSEVLDIILPLLQYKNVPRES